MSTRAIKNVNEYVKAASKLDANIGDAGATYLDTCAAMALGFEATKDEIEQAFDGVKFKSGSRKSDAILVATAPVPARWAEIKATAEGSRNALYAAQGNKATGLKSLRECQLSVARHVRDNGSLPDGATLANMLRKKGKARPANFDAALDAAISAAHASLVASFGPESDEGHIATMMQTDGWRSLFVTDVREAIMGVKFMSKFATLYAAPEGADDSDEPAVDLDARYSDDDSE